MRTENPSKFALGDRVKLNQEARESLICSKRFKSGDIYGKVVGKGRERPTIYVLFDVSSPAQNESYHERFFDLEPVQTAAELRQEPGIICGS